jgi:hypothetical protein
MRTTISGLTSADKNTSARFRRPRQRWARTVAFTAIAMLVALVAPALAGAEGAPAVYLSPSGSDLDPCTQDLPCRSLDRGYHAAADGGTVELAGGYYGCDEITAERSKTAAVVFRSATGQTAWTTCELRIAASHLVFENMKLAGIRSNSAQYLTLRNVDVACLDHEPFQLWADKCSAGVFLFAPASHFQMLGGSVGPTWDDTYHGAPGQSQIGINLAGGSAISTELVFDGVHFHDNRRIDDTQHTSCLMVGGGDGITIRNSRFDNCAVFDLFFTWWSFVSPQYPPATNILLENNLFAVAVAGCADCPAGYVTVEFADYQPVWENVTIRNNASAQTMSFDGSHSKFVVAGNAMPQPGYGCKSGIDYSSNVVVGDPCGSTDRVGSIVAAAPAGQAYLELSIARAALRYQATAFPAQSREAVDKSVASLDGALDQANWAKDGLRLDDVGYRTLEQMRWAAAWLTWADAGVAGATIRHQRNIVHAIGLLARARFKEVWNFQQKTGRVNGWTLWVAEYYLNSGDALALDSPMHAALDYESAWQMLLGQEPLPTEAPAPVE